MDEFRLNEYIARKREEVSALLSIAKDSSSNIDLMELIKCNSYFSGGSILNKDQITEILAARKLGKGEIELLEKILETLAKVKKGA